MNNTKVVYMSPESTHGVEKRAIWVVDEAAELIGEVEGEQADIRLLPRS